MTITAQLPDGTSLEFPDGTDDKIIDALAKHHVNQLSADQLLPSTLPVFGMDTGISIPKTVAAALTAAGKTTTRLGQTIPQAYNWLTGNQSGSDALKQQVDAENAAFAPVESQYPISTAVGSSLPTMAIPLGAPASLAGMAARAAGAGALSAGAEYGTPEERLRAAAYGGAGGAVGAGVGYGAGRILNPIRGAGPDAVGAAQDLASSYGINLTPGQATGSKPLLSLEGTLANLPGSSAKMAKVGAAQQQGFNAAALKTVGADATEATPDVIAAQYKRLGDIFQNTPKPVPVAIDEPLLTDLANVDANYSKNLTTDQKGVVNSYFNDILNAGPTMSGETYQKARAAIGARAESTQDSALSSALTGIKNALDSAFARSASPDTNATMALARQQYTALKTVAPLAAKNTNLSPASLKQALITQTGPERYAQGAGGDLRDVADLGQLIKSRVADSGTPVRSFWQNMLTQPIFGNLTNPSMVGAALPWVTAHALTQNLSPVRAYLGNSWMTPEIERLLTRSGGLLGGGATNALLPSQ